MANLKVKDLIEILKGVNPELDIVLPEYYGDVRGYYKVSKERELGNGEFDCKVFGVGDILLWQFIDHNESVMVDNEETDTVFLIE